ncbi:peptidoglycan-binding protein [Microbaculum marinum]|uniref:Peptidoglycan-binding protein n=1 Tax=Microbaculum marinum TaxID=1764581 RepID=A0AAW9RMD8_9HYPH
MRGIDLVRAVAPLARENYLAAIEAGDLLLEENEINTPARLAHFLAQVLHESGGLRVEWESMNYRVERLLAVFGVGRHSAGIDEAEARRLAHRQEEIAERVYGLGNLHKAAELGNVKAGDGYKYRGGGLMQTTGRYNYRRMGSLSGVDFETNPELIVSAAHALKPAVAEWREGRLNTYADADDLLSISRAINLGNARSRGMPNGFEDRKEWLRKVRTVIGRGTAPPSAGMPGRYVAMDLREVQNRLKGMGLYLAEVDGIYGAATETAIKALLKNQRVTGISEWPELRLIIASLQALCRIDGIEVGAIDGLLGPQTRAAFDIYVTRIANGGVPTAEENWRDEDKGATDEEEDDRTVGRRSNVAPAFTDSTAKSNWPTESGVQEYFGAPGSNQVYLQLPFPMKLAWDPAKIVRQVQCHSLVSESLERIWTRTLKHYGLEELRRLRLDMFGGCLNVRKKRGGTSWSMHAYGIAWDVDPERNALKMGRDEAALDAPEYDAFWEFVYAEGAVGLGRERNYDWMHFQFARLQ